MLVTTLTFFFCSASILPKCYIFPDYWKFSSKVHVRRNKKSKFWQLWFVDWYFKIFHLETMTHFNAIKIYYCEIGVQISMVISKILPESISNVRSVKKHTKHSSNTLLCLVCFVTERTLSKYVLTNYWLKLRMDLNWWYRLIVI